MLKIRLSFFFGLCLMLLTLSLPDSSFGEGDGSLMEQTLRETVVHSYSGFDGALNRNTEADGSDRSVPDWVVGAEKHFQVMEVDNASYHDVLMEVIFVGDHVVFWRDTQSESPLSDAFYSEAERFDQIIYPKFHLIFGSELFPGIDHDPRIHVVFSKEMGLGYQGYFSSRDELPKKVFANSNEMEVFFLNEKLLTDDLQKICNTLSHEFQHMIHYANDLNEDVFIDEGLSGLAETLSGSEISSSFINSYLKNINRSLIKWPAGSDTFAYYGSSGLFATYLYNRFGKDFIRKLVSIQANGMDGIDEALSEISMDADTVFGDWVLLQMKTFLGYSDPLLTISENPVYDEESSFIDIPCADGSIGLETAQYGVSLLRMRCSQGAYQITVHGKGTNSILTQPILSGKSAWWTNSVNNSLTTLSRSFFLPEDIPSPILSFDVSYKIEPNFDFLYILISKDNGETWEALESDLTVEYDAAGVHYGSALTGDSNGWIHEEFDLSSYAGETIILRFEYITDTSENHEGALIDNIAIDAIGFVDDAESNSGGWEADGFIRLQNEISQRVIVQTIFETINQGEKSLMPGERWTSSGDDPYTWICDFNRQPLIGCFTAISPINRYSFLSSAYTVSVERIE